MTKVEPEPTQASGSNTPEAVVTQDEDTPKPSGVVLYGRMLCTGCFKCILPILFILLSEPVAEALQGSDEIQEAFEQIAGGLLLYTFAYGCWAEIAEQFEHAAGEVGGRRFYLYAGLLLLTMFLGPLFYVMFELDGGDTVFDHGVTGSSEAVCPEHPALLSLNLSSPLCSCSAGRAGTASQPTCTTTTYDMTDMVPYLIGFALDGMVLVLLEGEEELFSLSMMCDPKHSISIFFTVWLKPIMFALDNVLTGTAMATVVAGVASSTGIGKWSLYFLCAAMTIVGVLVAMAWHALTALAPPVWTVILRLAFMTLAALSFLDNGLEMIRHGLTFFVGIGFMIGFILKLLGSLVDEVWEPYILERFANKEGQGRNHAFGAQVRRKVNRRASTAKVKVQQQPTRLRT